MKNSKFFLVAVSFFGLFVFGACSNNNESTTPVIQDITESVYASGIIKAKHQYDVFSTVNGIILQSLVVEGDSVQEGTPLFVIDNVMSSLSSDNARLSMEILKDKAGPESATLLELESRLKLAEAKYNNDSSLFIRQQKLWEQNVGSKVEFERRELVFKASKTDYYALKLQFQQAKSELEKSYKQAINNFEISKKQQADFIVKSNLAGRVYSILKEPGEFVSVQTPIAVIGQSNKFEIELQADEYDIVKIRNEQQVFVSMDSYRGRVFEATVVKVEPFMNPRTRTFTIKALFKDQPEILYPNLSVEANILIAKKEKATTIPAGYLIGKNRVLTAPKETTEVTTGISNLQWVEVTEGINSNQQIFLPAK